LIQSFAPIWILTAQIEEATQTLSDINNTIPVEALPGGGFDMGVSLLSFIIYLLLAILSVLSWAIIIKKIIDLRAEKSKSKPFRKLFSQKEGDIVALSQEGIVPNSSLARLFVAAYEELRLWATLDRKRNCIVANRPVVTPLERTLDRTIEMEKDHWDYGTTLLATISTVSPLLGLLGTVWGIYISFQQMGMQENTNLSTVSQGISEALLTTVAGLLVAIPAVFAHNAIVRAVRSLENHMESFAYEIINHFDRQIVVDPTYTNRTPERKPTRGTGPNASS
jgi:biopolymer transport protein TolQ